MSEVTDLPNHSLHSDARWFMFQIHSRKRTLPIFAHTANELAKKFDGDFVKFIEQHSPDKEYHEDGSLKRYIVPEGYYSRHNKLKGMFSDFAIFASALPNMTLVSVVSLFDAYLARILKNLFLLKPEQLISSGRQITFAELIEFGSIENAQQYFIEKEIEAFLRESHATQFEQLEKRIGSPLTKLPAWKDFIELTERRNLLVHCDGMVSAHYIQTCLKHGVTLPDNITVGDQLHTSPEYYQNACDCVAEIGLKLNQVIWRKLLPDELESAENSFIEITYDLLIAKEYSLAEKLLALSTERSFAKLNAETGLLIMVNLAIALKGQSKNKECIDLLSALDFSALSQKFKLANQVLREDFAGAAETMEKIGNKGEVAEVNYREWPLFQWFRKTNEFKQAFEKIYGYRYAVVASHKSARKLANIEISEIDDYDEDEESPDHGTESATRDSGQAAD